MNNSGGAFTVILWEVASRKPLASHSWAIAAA